jgi:hypothetical protein
MAPESFALGAQVFHIKMQIIGTVEQVIDDMVYVKIAENKPLQAWKREDLAIWDQKKEIQNRLKRGGYIRSIFKKAE